VLSGFSLAKCTFIRISATLLDMSDDLSPHPNVVIELHLCLYMFYEMNVIHDK
jgi:hypothetical protein